MKFLFLIFFVISYRSCSEFFEEILTINRIYKNQSIHENKNYIKIYKIPISNLKKNQWFKIIIHYLGSVKFD